MKRHSIFIKLLLGNLLLVVVIIAVGGLVSYKLLDSRCRAECDEHQDRLAGVVQHFLELACPLEEGKVDPLCKQLAQEVLKDSQIRLTVIADDGRVLGDSAGDPGNMENHKSPDRPEMLAALAGRNGRDVRRSETLKTQFTYVARPIWHQGRVAGAVRLSMPVKVVMEREGFIRDALLWSALAGVVIAVLLGLLVSWIWYAPLRRISMTARQLASGDLSAKVRIRGSDELVDLGRALDEMRDSLTRQIGAVSAQRENLQTVLANLREGVIALDADGRIVLMNRSAGELLDVTDAPQAIGKNLQVAVRVPDVVDLYNRTGAAADALGRQIEIHRHGHRRMLDVHAAKVPTGASEAISGLLVIRDVTDLARATAMKAEFVANASHELRTPLATVRAAVDSLAAAGAEDPQVFAKCLEILDRHVQRLQDMTNDLLDLHAVETGKVRLRLDDVNLSSLAEWSRGQFAHQAAEKGLQLEIAADPSAHFRSDRKLVELILRNLIDNAIKFTPRGGRVDCALQRQEKEVLFRVSDTGCGIRPEDQPRVFERFFQGDASRSGDAKARGTGLGLAIVRHCAERLGGKVMLESQPGKGTTVTILLPDRADALGPDRP